jgi:20S proteasome alpha/beta subunit
MLTLNPRLASRLKLRRAPRRNRMTIAIGTYFADGVILCADSKFVDDNGNISYAGKIAALEVGGRTFAIAHAANDSNAAAMLSSEILEALETATEQSKIVPSIKKCMTKWQSDYAQTSVPLLQFLVACIVHGQQSLYFCQPPNVVIKKYRLEPTPIGSAVKIVEALLPFVLFWARDGDDPDPIVMSADSTLLKLAYLMRRAHKEDLYVGGDTDALILYKDGRVGQATRSEMKEAEEFSESLDRYFKYACYGLFSQQPEQEQKEFLERVALLYLRDTREVASKTWFPSLEGLGT